MITDYVDSDSHIFQPNFKAVFENLLKNVLIFFTAANIFIINLTAN